MMTVLPTPGAPEKADLASTGEGLDQVDDLDAGLQHLGFRALVHQAGSRTVDRISLLGFNRAQLVDGLSQDIEDPAQGFRSHRDADGSAQIEGLHAPHHSIGGLHGDAFDHSLSQVMGHFQGDVDGHRRVEPVGRDTDGMVDGRNVTGLELHVDDRTLNLQDLTHLLWHILSLVCLAVASFLPGPPLR